MDASSLTVLLREAEYHHAFYEPNAPKHHWSDWYAAFMIAREHGKTATPRLPDRSLNKGLH